MQARGVKLMCKYAYEAFSNLSSKVMIYCHLKDNEKSDIMKLCIGQRYCNTVNKYVEYNQRNICKHYL